MTSNKSLTTLTTPLLGDEVHRTTSFSNDFRKRKKAFDDFPLIMEYPTYKVPEGVISHTGGRRGGEDTQTSLKIRHYKAEERTEHTSSWSGYTERTKFKGFNQKKKHL